jgi:hypothetical protein
MLIMGILIFIKDPLSRKTLKMGAMMLVRTFEVPRGSLLH